MIAEHSKSSPEVMGCPPVVFIVAMAVGLLLSWLVPMHSFACRAFQIVGSLMGLAGTTMAFWGIHAFHRAGTSVRPGNPVTALVTTGPFRFTRNPLYMAMTLIYVGLTISMGLWWPFATLVPVLVIVHWRIVRREEEFLEARFGDTYRNYKARVNRWI